MPDKDGSVTVADSLDAEDQGDKSQSAEGEKPSKDLEKKIRENLKAEYERKHREESETMRREFQNELQAKIDELEAKSHLTQGQEDRLEALKRAKDGIRSDKNWPTWREIIREEIRDEIESHNKANYDRMHETSRKKADAWIADKAKSLNLSTDALGEEMLPFLEDRFLDLMPLERVQRAYDEMVRIREKYSKSRGENMAERTEGEARAMRKVSKDEAVGTAKKSGDWRNVLSKVADGQGSDESKGYGK